MKLKIIFLIIFFLFNISFSTSSENKMQSSITYLEGNVKYCGSDKIWRTAKINLKLNNGDIVKTGKKSRVEIKFFEGSILRLDQYTEIKINKMLFEEQKKKNSISVEMNKGNVWSNLKKSLKAETNYEIGTPLVLTGVRSTTYRIEVEEDNTTLLRVYKGKVEVKTWIEAYEDQIKIKRKREEGEKEKKEIEGPYEIEGPIEITKEEWIKLVGEMQELKISPDKLPKEAVKFNEDEDNKIDWVRWNKERDKIEN